MIADRILSDGKPGKRLPKYNTSAVDLEKQSSLLHHDNELTSNIPDWKHFGQRDEVDEPAENRRSLLVGFHHPPTDAANQAPRSAETL